MFFVQACMKRSHIAVLSWQVVARHGVIKQHSFLQSILHVWCETQRTANIMEAEYRDTVLQTNKQTRALFCFGGWGRERPVKQQATGVRTTTVSALIMATKQSIRGGCSGVATGVRRSRVPLVLNGFKYKDLQYFKAC
jgi:hypothetical protein